MSETDPNKLAAKFAEMSDESLAECLAEGREAYEDFAWDILTGETRRRGIPMPAESAAASPEPEPEAGVEVFSTTQPMEAEIVRGVLASDGIEVLSFGDNMMTLQPLWRSMMDGIKLVVKPEDAERAREVIREYQTNPDGSAD